MRTVFNKKKCFTLLSTTLLMSAMTAHAAKSDSATITISGVVQDTTCQFNTDIYTTTLDSVADTAFKAVGETMSIKEVLVSFTCGSDSTGVKISVAGEVNQDGTDTTAFKDFGGSTGIALRLLASNGSTVLKPSGTSSTSKITLDSNHTGTYTFKAGYVKTADVITPGSFTSVVSLSFNYN
ncbi:hypothetical protein GTPT_1440 [Tatumella ptyseos ATCC 33301]|uniref:Fimbrial-type adhesion domain-containing protein n=2 Tax=Tatumella ptyseos TaxID=82987 RepID=A0A085JHP7_9GAMM|nr:fimbrial protein [Tatumella ptyseos]KFD19993.1 hypothetical protein GTPT_1440 [Tatumella ptyseos ATCC 33301]SQK75937.1 long polar fimbrial protein LpfE [Tatumella ptyseos]